MKPLKLVGKNQQTTVKKWQIACDGLYMYHRRINSHCIHYARC